MTPRLLLFWLVFLAGFQVQAQDEWELKRNENGIEVYTRKQEDAQFKEIKIVTVLPGTTRELVAAVMDVDSYQDWVYGIKDSYVLKKINNTSIIYYNEVDLPWPFSDRDLVNHITVQKDPKSGKTVIQSKAIPDHIPKKDDLVRIPFATANWDITPVADKELKVVYTFRVNPGGSLPPWLVNSIATVGPYNTFVELRKKLQQ
ncbi:START domain-containing protein [Botryobacter ruber]|uniref:START domain-containing protein n=1 Tax=Botryobacter ruber TaxID=2171629 RepID=UPI0013E3AF00|nr:START domain-containing protein [Botryobacter ruber]